MPTSEELEKLYELSARPYLEAPCPCPWEDYIHMRSWRYVFEINSNCNLHCALCHAGNRKGYFYKPGVMDMGLFNEIIDKIQSENPKATVCAYVNSEPFLHPKLAECVRAIKAKGLKVELASNGNWMPGLDEVMSLQPDLFTVSVSGFSQEVYERAHRGGNVETVKRNIICVAEAARKYGRPFGTVGVSYHKYKDNIGSEMEAFQKFTSDVGLVFMTSCGRTICIENTVQALMELESRKTGIVRKYEVVKGVDLNTMLPASKPEFIASMDRLIFHPEKAMKLYEQWPLVPVCLIADLFTEIRWDGQVQLCAWTDDMRLTLGKYLDMSQQQIREARVGHPLCKECLRYRLNLYFHIVDKGKWEPETNI